MMTSLSPNQSLLTLTQSQKKEAVKKRTSSVLPNKKKQYKKKNSILNLLIIESSKMQPIPREGVRFRLRPQEASLYGSSYPPLHAHPIRNWQTGDKRRKNVLPQRTTKTTDKLVGFC
jgi:hypothetical protein